MVMKHQIATAWLAHARDVGIHGATVTSRSRSGRQAEQPTYEFYFHAGHRDVTAVGAGAGASPTLKMPRPDPASQKDAAP